MIEGGDLEIFERSVRQATSRFSGHALDTALTELGWADALSDDPETAIAVLFPMQGRELAVSSALQQVLAAALDVTVAPGTTLLLPWLDSWEPCADEDRSGLRIRGAGTDSARRSDTLLVPAWTGADGIRIAAVASSDTSIRHVAGIDPAFGLTEVTAADSPYSTVADATREQWELAVALAQLSLGHELVGAARAMLELARAHALERVQFGQPIAHFQAVRHRLAETLVAIEAAEGVLDAAAELGADLGAGGQGPSVELARVAKALAGRSARTAARHCQQVLAGIGFTAEHPFHRYFRRVLLLDQLFGTARSLTEDLGRRLLASRHLPDLLPL